LPHPPPPIILLIFSFYVHGPFPDLHSFPTRRSSDLPARGDRRGPGDPLAGCTGTLAAGRPRLRRGRAAAGRGPLPRRHRQPARGDRKSTRLNSSHVKISYAVFCLKKKKEPNAKKTSR